MCENIIRDLCKNTNLKYFILRYFNVAGADKRLRSGQISKRSTHLIKILSENKIMSSKSEARRAIIGKGLRVNDKIVDNDKKILQQIDFKEKIAKVSYGKKKHYIVKII